MTRLPPPNEIVIRTHNLRKSYSRRGTGTAHPVLDGTNLLVRRDEFIAVVGRSGCGKSTLLRILAGAAREDGGEISVLGQEPSQLPPGRVVLVFQDYSRSLLPWRSAAGNVRFALERMGLERSEMRNRTADALERVNLTKFATLFPAELSGGMQQRLQLARAIAARPEILLLDEPFGSLDALTRYELEDELQKLCGEGMTAVLVTHDIDEAVYLADRVIVLGGSPAAVEINLKVDLPRPRSQGLTKASSQFAKLRNQLLEKLFDGRSS